MSGSDGLAAAAAGNTVKALIPTGLGFNCEYESAKGFEFAGGEATICDIRDLLSGKVHLFQYDALMLVGGFSFGDDLGSGKAMANLLRFRKIRTPDGEVPFVQAIESFVQTHRRVVLGVCNGFQVLVKLRLLPGFGNPVDQVCTLTSNDSGRFEDRWVTLRFSPDSPCIATRGLGTIELPVRHGEGKLLAQDEATMARLVSGGHIFAQYANSAGQPTTNYPENPNGSPLGIAGLCDATGRIIGLMPHPEAFLLPENHPRWTRIRRECLDRGERIPCCGQGLDLFKNIVSYCKEVKRCYPTPLSESN